MRQRREKTVEYTGGSGYCATVYTDDAGGTGYGDNPRVAYYYGSREECEALDPYTLKLEPMALSDGPDPFDLACERRFD